MSFCTAKKSQLDKSRAEALLRPTVRSQTNGCGATVSAAPQSGAEPLQPIVARAPWQQPVPPTALPQAWDSSLALRLCLPPVRRALHPQRPTTRALPGASAAPRFPARLWRVPEVPACNLGPSHPSSPRCHTGKATLLKEQRATINNPGCFSGAICHKESQCAAVEPTVKFRYTTICPLLIRATRRRFTQQR